MMLITSRESRRWVIPKGWPMRGLKPHRAAEREAYEEAGLKGHIGKVAVGFMRTRSGSPMALRFRAK